MNMKNNLLQSLLATLLCAVLLTAGASCYASETNAVAERTATAAAQKWLALIDKGDYAQSWKNASAFFQSAVTEEQWKTALETVRKPLGNLVSRELKAAKTTATLPGAPAGQYVVMQFQTSFADKKSAVETVTFMLEKDGQWKSCGYFIK
jgi:hypothetical protein